MFDPDDASAMAAAVLRARALGDRGVDRGLEQCRRFTWAACVDVHERVYVDVAGVRRG